MNLGEPLYRLALGERLEAVRGRRLRDRFDEGVPRMTRRALALPLRRLPAAFRADVQRFLFSQLVSSRVVVLDRVIRRAQARAARQRTSARSRSCRMTARRRRWATVRPTTRRASRRSPADTA